MFFFLLFLNGFEIYYYEFLLDDTRLLCYREITRSPLFTKNYEYLLIIS